MPSTSSTAAAYVAASVAHAPHNVAEGAQQHSQARVPLENVTNTSKFTAGEMIRQMFTTIGSGLRHVLEGARNLFTCCIGRQGGADEMGIPGQMAPAMQAALTDFERQMVMEVLPEVSDKLVAAVFEPTSSLADIGQRLRILSGQIIKLAQGNPSLRERILDTLKQPVVLGLNVDEFQQKIRPEMLNAEQTAKARIGLMQHLDNVRGLLERVAAAEGNPVARAQLTEGLATWFKDPMLLRLDSELGCIGNKTGEVVELINSPVYSRPEEIGGKCFSNRVRLDNLVTLADGRPYLAHKITVGEGKNVGIAMSFPQAEHLPQATRLIRENGGRVIVLASDDDIHKHNLPPYFTTTGNYGGTQIKSVAGERLQFGSLTVQAYESSVESGSWSTLHVEGWPDFGGSQAEAVVNFGQYIRERYGDEAATRLVTHCRAGFGRTGTFQAVMAMLVHGVGPETAIRAIRDARAPDMVQTVDQMATVVRAWRVIEALSAQDQPEYAMQVDDVSIDEPIDVNLPVRLEPLYANLPIGPEPVYANLPVGPEPVYVNWPGRI